ncbi:LysR family transcriptional regulator [Phenylobacterium sp.]|uniref:LysR family transcriptional regulator n=1 Tax=Phenylobacterium sp. TaxID=1871053 RepID=UPI00273457DA|nr:LysR family transcriptional regulator [Phenylobacterium sp.]MDP3659340.1 LysR family transcriptional regulator [Phenylobacterium sp.]
MDRVDALRTFIAVADARSFTEAARRLGVSPSQASKVLMRLEDRLGARLLNRTTRDVALTDVGRAYLESARAVVEAFETLDDSVRDDGQPRGLLRVSAPVTFGAAPLQPALLAFAQAYPQVGLEVSFSDRTVNLVDEGFDVAVRITRLADSSLIARKLAETRIVVCASPDHLQRHGTPQTPEALAGREAILDLNLREPTLWDFRVGGARRDIRVEGRLRFSSPAACLHAAREGFGIARAPAFAATDDLRSGRLIPILTAFECEPIGVHAVYPHARHLAAKVRVFVDFLARRFAGRPAWHVGWG